MRIGLTFDEYAELRLNPPAGSSPFIQQAADQEREEMFPMNLASVSIHLRSRGYDCKRMMLELLLDNEAVNLTDRDAWTQEDVEAAAEYFEQSQLFVPYASMCQTLGCGYVGFLRPLREAAERESKIYGRCVPENDQYFVMHRVPPRGQTDDDGNMTGIQPSQISFTLCDDIKERLERGEEV